MPRPPVPACGPATSADRAPPAGIGQSFRDCPDCPEMVVAPAGAFMMGGPVSRKDIDDDKENQTPRRKYAPVSVILPEAASAQPYGQPIFRRWLMAVDLAPGSVGFIKLVFGFASLVRGRPRLRISRAASHR